MKNTISFVCLLTTLTIVISACNIQKTQYCPETNKFFDDFSELLIHPSDRAYWWTRNFGDDQIFEDQPCVEDSCVSVQEEDGVTFLDMALYPDNEPGSYTNVELSEYPSGYSYGKDGLWLPTRGHEVIMQTRVRFVGDFHQNGSGEVVGTAGIGFWNSPAEFPSPENPVGEFNPQTLIGFNWATDSNPIAKGLSATILKNDLPLGVKRPAFQVDMTDWITMKLVWRESINGTQNVSFWINDIYIGTLTLPVPLVQRLTLTIWHDNQSYSFTGSSYHNPVEEQNFQVDYVQVEQP